MNGYDVFGLVFCAVAAVIAIFFATLPPLWQGRDDWEQDHE